MQYEVKKGFGANRVKEYFVARANSDSIEDIIAGPFAEKEHAYLAMDACKPLYFCRLVVVFGHLAGYDSKGKRCI